jgi:hypothetical protein
VAPQSLVPRPFPFSAPSPSHFWPQPWQLLQLAMAARRRKVCAAASPLGSERVPHEGERAAVERFHDGALCPEPVRRLQLEVTFPRAGGAAARSSPRATAVVTVRR